MGGKELNRPPTVKCSSPEMLGITCAALGPVGRDPDWFGASGMILGMFGTMSRMSKATRKHSGHLKAVGYRLV